MAESKKIEDRINEVLTGDSLSNALDFTAFLQKNNINPECHESGDGWSVMRGNDSIGFISVNGKNEMPGPWTVWFNSCDFDENGPVDNIVKETAWEHASVCGNFSSGGKVCGCGDQPGFTRTIFGRVFENRCHSPLMFTDPDAAKLESVKKLILMIK